MSVQVRPLPLTSLEASTEVGSESTKKFKQETLERPKVASLVLLFFDCMLKFMVSVILDGIY